MNEKYLMLGLATFVLATGGLKKLYRERLNHRTHFWLALMTVLFLVWMAHGPQALLYNFFHHYFPGFRGIRVPARIGLGYLFVMAILGAIGMDALLGKGRFAKWAGSTALVALLLVENRIHLHPVPVPMELAALNQALASGHPREPLALLPLNADENLRLYHSLRHRRPMFNGRSSFTPEPQNRLYEMERVSGPSVDILNAIREFGVKEFIASKNDRSWFSILERKCRPGDRVDSQHYIFQCPTTSKVTTLSDGTY